jgi:hypothetical protein
VFQILQEEAKQAQQAAALDLSTRASSTSKQQAASAATGDSGPGRHVQVSKRAWDTYQKRLKGEDAFLYHLMLVWNAALVCLKMVSIATPEQNAHN